MSNNKLYSINILRFIAASFVLLSHIENKVHQGFVAQTYL